MNAKLIARCVRFLTKNIPECSYEHLGWSPLVLYFTPLKVTTVCVGSSPQARNAGNTNAVRRTGRGLMWSLF